MDSINNAMVNFFWGYKGNSPRMYFLHHWFLFMPKNLGSLGLQDSRITNRALLAMQTWIVLDRPDSIVSKWVRNKNLIPHFDFQLKPSPKASHAWKDICRNFNIITYHLR